MISSRKKWLSLTIAASFFIGPFSALGDVFQALPDLAELERWALFSLGGDVLANRLTKDTYVQGDVGLAGSARIWLSGNAIIDGDLYYRSNGILKIDDAATITGVLYNNVDADLDNGLNKALSVSDYVFALAPSISSSFKLNGNQNVTFIGAPGDTVVVKIRNFVLNNNSTLTLQGTATTTFIINVKKAFSLSGNAHIILAGGLQWDDILFNVYGKGSDISLSGNARLEGILLATRRTVNLADDSIITGEVIANRIMLADSSSVIHPPIASP